MKEKDKDSTVPPGGRGGLGEGLSSLVLKEGDRGGSGYLT